MTPTDEEARAAAQQWLRARKRRRMSRLLQAGAWLLVAGAFVIELWVRYFAA